MAARSARQPSLPETATVSIADPKLFARQLTIAEAFASHDRGRPVLRCVHFTSTHITATDSWSLVRFAWDSKARFEPRLLDIEDCAEIRRLLGRRGGETETTLLLGPLVSEFRHAGRSIQFPTVTGSYPATDILFEGAALGPGQTPSPLVALAPWQLKRLGLFGVGRRTEALEIQFPADPLKPVRFQHAGLDAEGLVMPVRARAA